MFDVSRGIQIYTWVGGFSMTHFKLHRSEMPGNHFIFISLILKKIFIISPANCVCAGYTNFTSVRNVFFPKYLGGSSLELQTYSYLQVKYFY